MKKSSKLIVYLAIAFFLAVGYPGLLYVFVMITDVEPPPYVMLPSLIGYAMFFIKGLTIWLDYVTHRTERTKDMNYPDPTIIGLTGIKYKEDEERKEDV